MPPKVKFEFDQPQTLAFTQDRGKAVESRFGGEAQFFRNVEGLKCAYLPASLERMLLQMNYRAGESVVITKRKTASGATYWETDFAVERPQPKPAPEHREPTAPVPRSRPIAFPPNKYFSGEPPALQFPEVDGPAPAKSPGSADHGNGAAVADPTAMHHAMASVLQSCLCAAIDAGREAQTYAGAHGFPDRKSTRLNSSHLARSRMPSSA